MIYVKDCISGMNNDLEADSIGICVTSPPYNLNIKYGTYEDSQPRNEYLSWLDNVFTGIKRVLKPDGHFFLNMGYSNTDPWIGMDAANTARRHFKLQNHINWVKSIYIKGKTSGNFKPINSNRYATPVWEHLFHFTHDGNQPVDRLSIGVPYEYPANSSDKATRWRGRRVKALGFENWKDFEARATAKAKNDIEAELQAKQDSGEFNRPNLRCRGNTWFVPYQPIRNRDIERGSHPATYPVELVEMCIRFAGCRGPVLDPFMGTGSTALAAQNLGLEWVGFEIDADYAAFADKRVNKKF